MLKKIEEASEEEWIEMAKRRAQIVSERMSIVLLDSRREGRRKMMRFIEIW